VSVPIRRGTARDEHPAWALVEEYNDAVDVLVRDDRATFRT